MERLVFWHRWQLPKDLDDALLQRASDWTAQVRRNLEEAGGEVTAQAGASVVALFDATDLPVVVELALALLARRERSTRPRPLQVTIALSVGTIAPTELGYFGEPFERAEALAHAAEAGSLVLDALAQQPVAGDYLFSHSVHSPEGIPGEVLDRAYPRRRECRAALRHLKPVTSSAMGNPQFVALRQLAAGEGRQRVAVVGPHGVGAASWLAALASELEPPLWLRLGPVAGSMAPLGSLAFALRRVQRSARPVDRWLDPSVERDAAALTALAAIRDGRAVSKRAAVGALRHLLGRVAERSGKRGWLDLTPVAQLDPASQRVVAEATREGAAPSFTVLRLLPGQKPPSSFGPGSRLTELRVAALTHRDAQRIAATMLGEEADRDIARKAALTGGPTVLGVVEAVRTMVSSGELVFTDDTFRWRRGPGGRGGVIPLETLLEQRLEQLEAAPRRVLEAMAVVPDTSDGEVVEQVAQQDGLDEAMRVHAVEQLIDEGYLTHGTAGLELSMAIRGVVSLSMPSARRAELCRFVGHVLEQEDSARREFGCATLAHYYAHGGRGPDAVRLFMETARLAGKLGWVRTAVRLAAAAVQTDPTEETRQAAAALTRALTREAEEADEERTVTDRKLTAVPEPSPAFAQESVAPASRIGLSPVQGRHDDMGERAIQRAIDALLARDAEEVERSLELAMASGQNGGAVERLRAMLLLTKGDHHGALRVLKNAQRGSTENVPARALARLTLAEALVWLEADQVSVALRSALRALAAAQREKDGHGVRASLRTLATCYRRLGREQDAVEIETAV